MRIRRMYPDGFQVRNVGVIFNGEKNPANLTIYEADDETGEVVVGVGVEGRPLAIVTTRQRPPREGEIVVDDNIIAKTLVGKVEFYETQPGAIEEVRRYLASRA